MPKKQKHDWSRVADERCLCGHLKSMHTGVVNHGACLIASCRCTRFTWREFVDAQGRKVA